jgi:hypothetical protein
MAVLELSTFRLAAGVTDERFLAVDERVQGEFAHHQPGLARRTTARAAGGRWAVLTLWASEADAEAAHAAAPGHPAAAELLALIDGESSAIERFTTLD